MNIHFLPDNRGQKVLHVEAAWSDVSADYEDILSGHAKVPIPGFRSGMMPRGVIEQRLQKQIVDDLSQRAARRLARKALGESGVEAAGRVEISDIECGKGQPFRFTVRFWPRPAIELPDLCSFALSGDDPVQAGPGDDGGSKDGEPGTSAENRIRRMLKQIARQEGSEVAGADGER